MSQNSNPWTGGEWEQVAEYVVTRGPKGGFVQIGKALARKHERAGGGPEQLANARLMAAAPAMLRAVRRILGCDLSSVHDTDPELAWVLGEAAELVARVTDGRG